MPVRLILTPGTAADCAQAPSLMSGLEAEYLLADRGGACPERSEGIPTPYWPKPLAREWSR